MLAYHTPPLRVGRECPHCVHVLRRGEDPGAHLRGFHKDRIAAQRAYDQALARGATEAGAQAAYNAVLVAYSPGPGKYPRHLGQVIR